MSFSNLEFRVRDNRTDIVNLQSAIGSSGFVEYLIGYEPSVKKAVTGGVVI